MLEKSLNRKLYAAFLLTLCLFTGFFFAFIWEKYWPKIQYADDPLNFPISAPIFYFFCILSYLIQGVSFIILSEHRKKTYYEVAFLLFWTQFFLSVLWLGAFFGLKQFGLALSILMMTFGALCATFYFMRTVHTTAAFLLIPAGILITWMGIFNAWFFVV